jgi:ABC-2 type transport system permease protein
MLHKYWVLLKVNWSLLLEYRAGMLIWVLANTLPLVMLAVWLTIADAGPVGAYGAAEFTAYYLALLLVRQMTSVWVAWELDYAIRKGELSTQLLRPIDPIHDHVALHLADKIFRLFTAVPPILLAAMLVPGVAYPTDPVSLALFLFTMAVALAIRFMSQYCIGLLGFWITQSLALNEMLYAGMVMFGGVIAPLELFPPAVGRLAEWLPFRYMLSLPVEILLGRLTGTERLASVGIQILWLTVLIVVYRLLWRVGIKRYSAVGA